MRDINCLAARPLSYVILYAFFVVYSFPFVYPDFTLGKNFAPKNVGVGGMASASMPSVYNRAVMGLLEEISYL